MTAPTPERPLDVEKLRRLVKAIDLDLRNIVISGQAKRDWLEQRHAILAALTELEGLRAEVERLRTDPCSGACLLKLKHHGEPDFDFREAEEVSGG